jgi:hypothetical protein
MDPDQTVQMRRLVWIHAGCKRTVGFAMARLRCQLNKSNSMLDIIMLFLENPYYSKYIDMPKLVSEIFSFWVRISSLEARYCPNTK